MWANWEEAQAAQAQEAQKEDIVPKKQLVEIEVMDELQWCILITAIGHRNPWFWAFVCANS